MKNAIKHTTKTTIKRVTRETMQTVAGEARYISEQCMCAHLPPLKPLLPYPPPPSRSYTVNKERNRRRAKLESATKLYERGNLGRTKGTKVKSQELGKDPTPIPTIHISAKTVGTQAVTRSESAHGERAQSTGRLRLCSQLSDLRRNGPVATWRKTLPWQTHALILR